MPLAGDINIPLILKSDKITHFAWWMNVDDPKSPVRNTKTTICYGYLTVPGWKVPVRVSIRSGSKSTIHLGL